MARECPRSGNDPPGLSPGKVGFVPPDPRGIAIHANSDFYYCITCGKITTDACKQCLEAHYCSYACQKADWETHKWICKSLSEVERPEGAVARVLFFPVDKDKPQWIWLPLTISDTKVLPEYTVAEIDVKKQLGLDILLDTNNLVDDFVNSCHVPKGRDLKKEIILSYWNPEEAAAAEQPKNQSIQSLGPGAMVPIHGPLLLSVSHDFSNCEDDLDDATVKGITATIRPEAVHVTAADFSYAAKLTLWRFGVDSGRSPSET